jgi:hypothetical protein
MGMARHPRSGMRLLALLCTLTATPALALEQLTLSLGDLQGEGWSVRSASLELGWHVDGALQARLRAAQAGLPEPLGELHDLRLECGQLELQGALVRCRQGRLQAVSSLLGQVDAGLGWELDRASGALDLQLRELRNRHGRLEVGLQLRDGAWQLAVEIAELPLDGLPALAAPWYVPESHWTLQGSLQGQLRMTGRGGELDTLAADLVLPALGYANDVGTQAAEDLQLQLQVQARPVAQGWALQVQARAAQGQVYAAPMFFEFDAAAPLEIQADLILGERLIQVESFSWRHPGTLQMTGAARLALGADLELQQLQLSIEQALFPAAFTTYLQPWLLDSGFHDLRTAGALEARLDYASGAITQLQLGLHGLGLDDPRGRFQLEGLAGQIDWAEDDQTRRQQLRWERGQLYRVALGALDVEVLTTGRQGRLAAPVRLPVLDGSLLVDHFALRHGDSLEWSLDAALTPISMPALTQALDWPEMAGTLSGMIPAVRYLDGELQVGGTLLVGAFDGDITVRNLRMEQPLGAVPRLDADIQIQGLDLETLTRTFAFGRIEGRLDGVVQGLRLEAWKPVAFDAWLATPEGDRSRQRISQRAVDNLTNIGGGGMGGALSRGFLRFLEDFPYRAIGLRCRLEQGVCHMGGVAPAERGYYLVQGRLLPPRIDVIGYEDRVDWESLLERLRAVTAEEGPEIR